MDQGAPLFYISTIQTDSIPIFIHNWMNVFPMNDQKQYEETIQLNYFNSNDIEFLLGWNFNSKSKRNSYYIELIKTNYLERINTIKKEKLLNPLDILFQFKELSSEWKIFILHIIDPLKFPLYHKYTLSAYAYLTGQDFNTVKRKHKINQYLNHFTTYIQHSFYDIPMIKTMNALYSFGYFLEESKIKINKKSKQ